MSQGTPSSRRHRLSRSVEFERVYRRGRSNQHRLLVAYWLDRPEDVAATDEGVGRLGLTVSRKVGNAVTRNRVKRQLTEAVHACGAVRDQMDIVLVARPGLPDAIEAQGFEWLAHLVASLLGVVIPGSPDENTDLQASAPTEVNSSEADSHESDSNETVVPDVTA